MLNLIVAEIVFTYSPTGLGHLRVMNALIQGRPKGSNYHILGSFDPLYVRLHKLFSINPFLKSLFEKFQNGWLEDVFTVLGRRWLLMSAKNVEDKLIEVMHGSVGRDLLIIATHPEAAHQIGFIKARLENKLKSKIKLVVQVTDDSPQKIWVVPGADLTFIPSRATKEILSEYADKKHIFFPTEVSPYPINEKLISLLPKNLNRSDSLCHDSKDPINVIVPISGAAVGLEYLKNFLAEIDQRSKRFRFFIVAKRSKSTQLFLSSIGKLRWVQVATGRNDSETVSIYDKVYQSNLIHFEITKPSEQAFKAQLSPSMVGGSILLFTQPVGRQEYDNLDFLKKHGLLEGNFEQSRCFSLEKDPKLAAKWLVESINRSEFCNLGSKQFVFDVENKLSGEISEKGVFSFWEKLKILGWV